MFSKSRYNFFSFNYFLEWEIGLTFTEHSKTKMRPTDIFCAREDCTHLPLQQHYWLLTDQVEYTLGTIQHSVFLEHSLGEERNSTLSHCADSPFPTFQSRANIMLGESIRLTFKPRKQQHAKLSFSLMKVTEQIRIMPKSRITGCHEMSWWLSSMERLYKNQDEKLPGKCQPLSSSQETKVKMTNQHIFQKCLMRGCNCHHRFWSQ